MIIRKTRRISYARKAKLQRTRLYTILIVIFLLFACSLATLADDGSSRVTVIADSGDTLWSICEQYKPEDTDLRLYIDKVKYLNKLKSSALSIGQEIVLPLD
ncbi:MAG: LysM peptidoglycan-binding domain-containing protein [Ruminococcaceae bacterium]|nr:LysM peptidoglycan-binding domain-containing protein [Oscillospiraceae bacterium]